MATWGGRNPFNLGIPGYGGNANIGGGVPGGPGGSNNMGGNGNNDDDGDWVDEPEEQEEDGKGTVVADFDPRALERGAKALREIDASENAKGALRLAMAQEKTKQREMGMQAAQLEQQNIMARQQLLEQEHSKQRQMEQERFKRDKEHREHNAKLKQEIAQKHLQEKRRTNEEWLNNQKKLFEEQQRLEKQTAVEIEEEKRRTMKYQSELNQDTAKIRANAEAEGRIKQERQNADITEKLSRTTAEEDRKTRMEIRKEELAYYASFFSGLRDTLTSPEKMPYLVGGVSAMAFGIYGSKMSLGVLGRYLESKIGKPSLVRETSRLGWRDYSPVSLYKRYAAKRQNPEDLMKNIILQPSLENKMHFVGKATRTTKENKAPFRHLLIYGPPGTGKTLFARSLAKNSGMDYAVVAGGDFAPLGASAVTELHKVFDWAEGSKKGMILFIDEADAFLRSRRG